MIRSVWDLYIITIDALAVLFFAIGGIGCLFDYIKEKRSLLKKSVDKFIKK